MISKLYDNREALERLNTALGYNDELFGILYPIGTPVKGGRIGSRPCEGLVAVGDKIIPWTNITPIIVYKGNVVTFRLEHAELTLQASNGDYFKVSVPSSLRLYEALQNNEEVEIAKVEGKWIHYV